jgi:hypothetical protein
MFDLSFNVPLYWLPVYLTGAAALTYWMYRGVAVPVRLKRVLMGLRFAGLFLLLLVLLEPLFTAMTEITYPPVVAVLHDDSESIRAGQDSAFLRSQYPELYRAFERKLTEAGIRLNRYRFGTRTEPYTTLDSVRYAQSTTHMSQALETIKDRFAGQNLAGVVVLSDGILTAGATPTTLVDGWPVPVFTGLIGDTTRPRDQLIETVIHNELTYLNTETPIRVQLRSFGLGNSPARVTLSQNGRVLQTQTSPPVSPAGAAVEFTVKLETTGLQAFDLALEPVPGETNLRNNSRRIYIRVLENRSKIAVFAGAAHPDLGALARTYRNDNRFEYVDFVHKNETEFYRDPSTANLREFDLFILHNFPFGPNDRKWLDAIYAEVRTRRVPLFVIIGSQYAWKIHPEQTNYLALTTDRFVRSTSEAFLTFTPGYKTHSTYRFTDDRVTADWLSTAPPLLKNDSDWQPRGGTTVYGQARIKGIATNYPLFALQENAGLKNLTLVGENLWRLRMHTYYQTQSFDLFDDWVLNLTQWLTTRDDKRRFRVYPLQPLFSGDDRVVIRGQAYDDSYNPIAGAELKLALKDATGTATDYYLKEAQPGVYQLELANLGAGTYRFTATGTKGGTALGTDAGEFSVGQSALEYVNLQANEPLMRQLALRSGGSFVFARSLPALADSLLAKAQLKPLSDYTTTTQSLIKSFWPLLLALLAFSAEWILRKRNSLI